MDVIQNFAMGLSVAVSLNNLLYCFIGALVGTLVGVLPGIGPLATFAMLLPITYYLPADSALIMLAGIYYGAQYGSSTTAILVNMPGETSSIVTTIDGYQMARKGRAGAALAVAALGSLFAGIVATLLIGIFSAPLAKVALSFGPAEYFSLMMLGLIAAVVLAQGSLLNAVAMIALGLLLGLIGADVSTGTLRMTLGFPELMDGIDFVPMSMGVIAFVEVVRNLEFPEKRAEVTSIIKGLWPSRDDFKKSWGPVLRGTGIGSILGVLPGGGALLASFASYAIEKRVAKDPSEFGKGAIQGVAGPESANNAGAQMSFIPLLTLGVPSNALMALMAGAMIMQGIQPGPQVMTSNPQLFWGIIASMLIGNVMLVIINLPLIRIWVTLLKIPYRLFFPVVLGFCLVGVYGVNSSTFDVFVFLAFGLGGYALTKLGCEPAPLLLSFVLSPLIEENVRRAMILSHGDASVFITSPVSGAMLLLAAILLVVVMLPAISKKREQAFEE